MSVESTRPRFWQKLRQTTDRWILLLPLPRVHPDVLSIISLMFAGGVLYELLLHHTFLAWVFLALNLFLDGLDGAVARKFSFRTTEAQRRSGELIDLLVDRLSEGMIFLAPQLFVPWFWLFLVNSALAVVQYRSKRALVQPLRLAVFVLLTFGMIRTWIVH